MRKMLGIYREPILGLFTANADVDKLGIDVDVMRNVNMY
jgi:hypothetical protein